MANQLPQLLFPYDVPEPLIDAKPMEIHHSKHHQGYVNKFNAVLEDASIDEILGSASNEEKPPGYGSFGGFNRHN
mgnify:CR=1 FL=1